MTTTSIAQQTTSGQEYAEACERWNAKKTDNSQIVLTGFGCGLSVRNNSLVCRSGFTNIKSIEEDKVLYRGTHGVESIFIMSDSGNITLDALTFCREQNICISVIDRQGNLVEQMGIECESNAKLRLAQYLSPLREQPAMASRPGP